MGWRRRRRLFRHQLSILIALSAPSLSSRLRAYSLRYLLIVSSVVFFAIPTVTILSSVGWMTKPLSSCVLAGTLLTTVPPLPNVGSRPPLGVNRANPLTVVVPVCANVTWFPTTTISPSEFPGARRASMGDRSCGALESSVDPARVRNPGLRRSRQDQSRNWDYPRNKFAHRLETPRAHPGRPLRRHANRRRGNGVGSRQPLISDSRNDFRWSYIAPFPPSTIHLDNRRSGPTSRSSRAVSHSRFRLPSLPKE
jgi:hypothetical protein